MYMHVVAARSDVGPRVTRVLGIAVGLMWGLGQDTLLGIVVDLCGASVFLHSFHGLALVPWFH
jgi:hypothetical protein